MTGVRALGRQKRQVTPFRSAVFWPATAMREQGAESGSTLPLILGYMLLALAVVYVCVCATDLYVAQKRLDAVADAAALAGADGYLLTLDGAGVRATLTDEAVEELAAPVVGALDQRVRLVSATAPDRTSSRVTVRTTWTPPLLSAFVHDAVTIEATATSRTALR